MAIQPIWAPRCWGVGGDEAKGFRGGLKEDAVDLSLVLKSNGGDLLREGEHNVEIRNGQQFGLPSWSHFARARLWHLGQ